MKHMIRFIEFYIKERKNEEQEGIDNSSDNNRFFTLWTCDE